MITVSPDTFPLAQVFTISRGSKTEARVLTVRTLREEQAEGNALGLTAGATPEEAAELANHASGVAVGPEGRSSWWSSPAGSPNRAAPGCPG